MKSLDALAGLILAAFVASAAAQPTPLVSTPAGTTYVATCTADTCSTRIPVVIATDKKVELQLVDLVYKDGRSDGLFKRFTVRLEAPNAAQAAVVVSAAGPDLWPGTYALTLRVDETPRKPDSTPQSVVVSFQLDAPTVISAASKVVVSQTVPFFGDPDQPSATAFKLAERSGKAAARQLAPLEFRDPPATGPAGSGVLTFEPKLADLTASGETTFKAIATGDFPLGTTVGRIEVQSRSLQAPVSVPLEIRARRPLYWILMIAAVGALVGWFVRTKMNADKALLDARAAYATALRAIARASHGRADAEYRLALSQLGQELADAEETQDPAKIVAAAKKAEEDAARLQKELEEKAKPVVARAQKLEVIFARDWNVPAQVKRRLSSLEDAYKAAVDALNRRDISDAIRRFDRLTANELDSAGTSLGSAVGRLADMMGRVSKSSFPLTPGTGDQVAQLASNAKAEAQRVPSSSADRVDALGDSLRRAHDLFDVSSTLAISVPLECKNVCQRAAGLLSEAVADARERFEPIELAAGAAVKSWSEAVTDPLGAFFEGSDVAEQWIALLMAVAPMADKAKMTSLVEAGQWIDSVRAAVKVIRSATAKVDTKESTLLAHDVPELEGLSGGEETPVQPRDAQPTNFVSALGEAPRIEALTEQRKALLAQSRTRAAVQSAGFAAVFVIGAYFVYGDTWIGTGKEIITLFVLAFGLDLTSDSVVAAIKK